MVQSFRKGFQTPISAHFRTSDFDCHCQRPNCTATLINANLPIALDALWELAGEFHIDSGFRCPPHNRDVGGAKDSQHLLGYAADCRSLVGLSGAKMASLAEQVPAFRAGGIGIYALFAHCDVRLWRARWINRQGVLVPC